MQFDKEFSETLGGDTFSPLDTKSGFERAELFERFLKMGFWFSGFDRFSLFERVLSSDRESAEILGGDTFLSVDSLIVHKQYTKIMRTFFTVLVLFSTLLDTLGVNSELKNGVIYLSNNEVYFCDLNHQNTIQLTRTNNKVSGFAISPEYRFLAYSKIVKYADEPGMWDSIPPKRAVCSIIMIDLKSDKIIREIFPSEYEWIYIDYWLNSKELLCHSADGFSVNDSYKINTAGIIDTLDYEELGSTKNQNLITPKYLEMRLIKDSLADIHFLDFKNRKNITLSQEKNCSHLEAISTDYESFLWSESFKKIVKKEELWQFEQSYHLNLYNLISGQDKLIINKDISPSIPFDKIQFSPDNRIVSCDLRNSDSISIHFINFNKHIDLYGTKTLWIDSNRFIYFLDKNLYVYDIDRNMSTLFLEDIKEAMYIK